MIVQDDEVERLRDKVHELESMLVKQHKINAALKERVKKSTQQEVSSYSLFESNILLQREIDKKTQHIKQALLDAEAANKAKSEFLANVSHELRTPIHAILGLSTLGQEDFEEGDSEKIGEYFENIHKSGRRLLSFVTDLLDLSKLESDHVELNFRTYNLPDVVTLIMQELEVLAKAKHVSLKLAEVNCNAKVYIDRLYIEQLVQNLLANAIKFTPDNTSVVIQLEASVVATDQGEKEAVLLSISDKGIGIPEDELETVFDKFIQSSKTNEGAGGTGLGLALCRQIVNLHHGEIWAQNNPDCGVTLYVKLPTVCD